MILDNRVMAVLTKGKNQVDIFTTAAAVKNVFQGCLRRKEPYDVSMHNVSNIEQ